MRTRTHPFMALMGIALAAAWTVACGSGSDSIAAPSPAGRGVTIQGTVTTSGSGGSSQGFGAGLPTSAVRISVVGSSLSTTADGRGRFSLSGVGAGDVTLRFQAAGVDARLTLGGLLDGQVLTISVHASGSDARLTSSADRDDHEFTGTVESVNPPALVVSGTTVLTNGGTEIKRGNLNIAVGDIQVGETAKVEGEQQADGSVLAREIKLSGGEGTGGQVQFTGEVESITPPSLVVAGRNVLTDANTEFKGKGNIDSLADLNVGDLVEAEGLESTPGIVLALEIKRLEEAGDDDDDDDDDDNEDDEDEDDEDEDEDEDSGS